MGARSFTSVAALSCAKDLCEARVRGLIALVSLRNYIFVSLQKNDGSGRGAALVCTSSLICTHSGSIIKSKKEKKNQSVHLSLLTRSEGKSIITSASDTHQRLLYSDIVIASLSSN